MRDFSAFVGFLVTFSMIGCGSSSNGPSDAGIDAAVDANSSVMASGSVVEQQGSAPIAGAQVCILENPTIPCATTDATGTYTISLPPWTTGLDIAVNVTAAGHLGFTGLVHEGSIGVAWFGQIPLMDNTTATTLLMTKAGFTYPPAGKAFIRLSIFHSTGGAVVGETAAVSPLSGSEPVYFATSGDPNPALNATTSNGYLIFGDLTPGKIEITVSGSTCSPVKLSFGAWDDAKPNTVAGETAADSITQLNVICQ